MVNKAAYYGYFSARTKAMSRLLLSDEEISQIIEAKDYGEIVSILYQKDFKEDLEEFGGVKIREDMIEFALSKNLARSLIKLSIASPPIERNATLHILGKWELENLKVALQAKDSGKKFEDIEKYLIDYGRYKAQIMKEYMKEESIEGILERASINSPYKKELEEGIEEYRKSKNIRRAIAKMFNAYYSSLKGLMVWIRAAQPEAARIIKKDIDIKNLLLFLEGKKIRRNLESIKEEEIEGGTLELGKIEEIYSKSDSYDKLLEMLPSIGIKTYGTRSVVEAEAMMRRELLEHSKRLLSHLSLSYGTIIAYAYAKDAEIFNLRIIINGKKFGIEREEMKKMIIWKRER
ncbi:MAG: V-type ATPase subunit [Candidatus Micrarchaeaceae archaeon]